MPNYMISYLGGKHPSDPEQAKQHFNRYMQWLNSLGDKAYSPMNPLKDTRTISPDGTVSENSNSSMSGYTLVSASSLDQAIALSKNCPFLDIGGSLEVSELVDMSGSK